MSTFYEFFAGGGMARAGLGGRWKCLFANDFDHKKSASYRLNWENNNLLTQDINSISTSHLPHHADLVWASFPCQDLSLAGGGAGLKGNRSGTFWPFWELMKSLKSEGRNPPIIALENVCGTLNSNGGKDFAAIGDAFLKLGYRFGAIVVDASLFVPHSRPRLFMVGIRNDVDIPSQIVDDGASEKWHTKTLLNAYSKLSTSAKDNWVWWKLDTPSIRTVSFADLIEENPSSVSWHSLVETKKLLSMMSDVNLEKVRVAKLAERPVVGTIYKRTRQDKTGLKVQRAEVRFDEIAGCLRTPAGGSSRQLILVVNGNNVKSRLISSRETARLMGLSDGYKIPKNYNEAYHLMGDGVVVPVVSHIEKHIFGPILSSIKLSVEVAA